MNFFPTALCTVLLLTRGLLATDYTLGIFIEGRSADEYESWQPTVTHLNNTLNAQGHTLSSRVLTGADEDYLAVDFLITPNIVEKCLDLWGPIFYKGVWEHIATISRAKPVPSAPGGFIETSFVCGITIARVDRTDINSYEGA